MKGTKGYQELIQKLDTFIRKYYTSQLIKGILLFIGLNLFLFLAFNVLESQFYFSSLTRKMLFYGSLGVLLFTFAIWVATPLIKTFKLGSVLSHDEAAKIVGDHFPEVKDKLLNILQLARQSEAENNDLILHSIEQKTEEIQFVPFPKAIDLSKNKKYLKYALPPLLLLVILLFSAPSLITDSSYRLLHNNQEFEREAPFSFHLLNESLSIPQFDDVEILLDTEGDVQPQEAFITIDNFQYKMKKNKDGNFSYLLKNVGNDTRFFFSANGFSSSPFEIHVLKKPSLNRMNISLEYPRYTQMENKTVQNEGDLVLPVGTKVTWNFDTENMSYLDLKFSSDIRDTSLYSTNDVSSYTERIYENTDYKLIFHSDDIARADSVLYSIESIPDEYPKISIQTQQDSLDHKVNYIVGEASDDYGIREVTFNYAVLPADADPDLALDFETEEIQGSSGKATTFDKIIDVEEFNLEPGASLLYYFEVFDNDGINGSKSSRTATQKWTQRTIEEFEELEEKSKEQIKSNLEELVKEQKNLIDVSEELRNKLLQEKDLSWQRKKEMEQLLENQQKLQQQLQETQQLHEQNMKNQEEYKDPDSQTNEEIQKLIEESHNPQLEELMKKIQELMGEMERDDALKELQEMTNQMQQSQMDMERLEKLYNKLQMESDIMEQARKLESLAEEQKKLAEENLKDEDSGEESGGEQGGKGNEEEGENEENGGDESHQGDDSNESSREERIKDQKEIQDAFEKISEKLQELYDQNQALDNPVNMENPKTTSEEIKRDQNESMKEMQEGSPQKAGEKQKDAGDKMEQMAQSMQQDMAGGQQEQMQEDMKTLRQILDNLIHLSFDQEDLIEEIAPLSYATPQYTEKVRKQFDLKNNFTLVKDSLLALANRNPQIQSTVTEKVNLIDNHLEKSIRLLEDQEKSQADNDQRRTMKNVNDLALMLTEALENMQMELSDAQSMCQNPDGQSESGSQPMDKITEGQEKLTEEMKDIAEKRRKGEGGRMSEEFAKIAAEQAALRKELEAKQRKLMEQGKGSKELQELIDLMDQMETDMVNKKMTHHMMQRQQEILTRLLEAEKAEREQDLDEKRKAETAKDIARTFPPELQEYLNQRREEITPYQKLSPSLKPYYRKLVDEYYEELKNR